LGGKIQWSSRNGIFAGWLAKQCLIVAGTIWVENIHQIVTIIVDSVITDLLGKTLQGTEQ
jgi:hypothetical protein